MPKKRSKLLQIRGDVKKEWYMAGAAGIFIAFLLLWSAASYGEWVERTFLPTPGQVLNQFAHQFVNREFWHHVDMSVYRVSMGFLLACVIGIPLGILAGTFRIFEAIVVPPTEFVRYMPATAFIPLIMVWAGIGESAKILVIFIGCVFQLILMVADNTRSVSNDLLQVSYTMGAKRSQSIERVLIPALLPDL